MRFTAIVFAFGLAALSSTALADPLKPLLSDLVDNHPRIKAAAEQVNASDAGKTEAFSGYLPKVTATAGKGKENTDRTDLSPAGVKTNYSTTSASVSVSQNLFEGFRTYAASKTADVTAALAEENLDLTRQQIILEAVSSYMDVLRHMELTRLSQENQNTLKTQLQLEDERVQRGSGIAVDILQAKSRLQIAKERFSAFTGALNDAVTRYTQVFGQAPAIESMLLPPLPEARIPATLEIAIKTALDNNPTLVSSKHTTSLADVNRTSSRANFYPSLDVVGSSSYDDNLGGIRGEEQVDSVELRATWQLFNGLADHARNRRASYDYQAALENTLYTQRKVAEEVRLAWSTLITSKDRAELLDNAVNIAGEVYDARRRLRDAGSDTALNVLDAENELFRAKIDAVAARYDYYTALYRLLYSMGMLQLDKI